MLRHLFETAVDDRMGVRAVAWLLPLSLLACVAVESPLRPEPARLKVVAEPPTASVYIDGHYFGRARVLAEAPKELPTGPHLMTIQADDHFPHDMEIELAPGTTTVEVKLRPVPP